MKLDASTQPADVCKILANSTMTDTEAVRRSRRLQINQKLREEMGGSLTVDNFKTRISPRIMNRMTELYDSYFFNNQLTRLMRVNNCVLRVCWDNMCTRTAGKCGLDHMSDKSIKAGVPVMWEGKDDLEHTGKIVERLNKGKHGLLVRVQHDADPSKKVKVWAKSLRPVNCHPISITLAAKVFETSIRKAKGAAVVANGITCEDVLDCIQLVFEHELVHAIVRCFCGKYAYTDSGPSNSEWKNRTSGFHCKDGHSRTFMSIVSSVFGHTKYRHNLFTTEQALQKAQERKRDQESKKTHVFLLYPKGSLIKYKEMGQTRWDFGKEYEGRVLRHGKNRVSIRLNDGKRILVPYSYILSPGAAAPKVATPEPKKDAKVKKVKKDGKVKTKKDGKVKTKKDGKVKTKKDGKVKTKKDGKVKTKKDGKVMKFTAPRASDSHIRQIKKLYPKGSTVSYKWSDGTVLEGKVFRHGTERVRLGHKDGRMIPYSLIQLVRSATNAPKVAPKAPKANVPKPAPKKGGLAQNFLTPKPSPAPAPKVAVPEPVPTPKPAPKPAPRPTKDPNWKEWKDIVVID